MKTARIDQWYVQSIILYFFYLILGSRHYITNIKTWCHWLSKINHFNMYPKILYSVAELSRDTFMPTHSITLLLGTVEDHGKIWQKNTANFWENRKNHGKGTASNNGPEDHYTVYETQHLALTTISTCSARFSSAKFCQKSLSDTEPVCNKAHGLW